MRFLEKPTACLYIVSDTNWIFNSVAWKFPLGFLEFLLLFFKTRQPAGCGPTKLFQVQHNTTQLGPALLSATILAANTSEARLLQLSAVFGNIFLTVWSEAAEKKDASHGAARRGRANTEPIDLKQTDGC